VIRNLAGLGFEHISKQGQDIMKAVVSVASDNYPEMMARSYMVNAPWVFNTLWFVLKGLLAERTVDKVSVYGHPFLSDLVADISLDMLPSFVPGL